MTTKMPQTASKTYLAQTGFLFHCHIKIKVPQEYGELLLDECFDLLEQMDRTYNSYQPGSYFHRINQNAGSWTDVDNACSDMLENIRFISECTKGAYDITCMPLLHLWGFYREENHHIPEKEEIAEVLKKVDYRSIELQKNSVRISEGQELITGSFIKAFAVDSMVKFLKEKGISDAVINAGGSTIVGLNDETHPHWKVNIPNAFAPDEKPQQINISNQCFSLSARSNNRIIIDGKPYGHILNSVSGYPASTVQVGVWSDEAFLGDVISTALFAVEKKELEETVRQLKKRFQFDYFRIEENR